MTHDVIIIGAGPAGATAALRARQLRLTVALVDKARFPREKLCGGGITGRCRSHLAEVFSDLPVDLWQLSSRIRLMDGPSLIADLTDIPAIGYTMRKAFDAALLAKALEAGAEDFTGQRIANLDLSTGAVFLAAGERLTARAIIGADGVNSLVARTLFGRAFDPARIGFALEAEWPLPKDGTEPSPMLDISAARYGYGWIFPKSQSLTLGLGGVQARNQDLQERFNTWLRQQGQDPTSVKIKGHHLPFGDPRPDPAQLRSETAILLVGDAAGLVDPITGEGIAWAVKSGQLAAEAVAKGLHTNRPDDMIQTYRHSIRPLQKEIARARQLSKLVYHPFLQAQFLKTLKASEHLQRQYFNLLAGKMDYADLSLSRFARLGGRLVAAMFRPRA